MMSSPAFDSGPPSTDVLSSQMGSLTVASVETAGSGHPADDGVAAMETETDSSETSATSPSQTHAHSHALHRRILTREDLDAFAGSDAHAEIVRFVARLAEAAKNKTAAQNGTGDSEPVRRLLDLLSRLDAMVDEFPPDDSGKSRFGNPSFRGWLGAVRERSRELLEEVLGLEPSTASNEAAEYLGNCFGSIQRIDYGTGHELHFVLFLYCLERLGFVHMETDGAQLVLLVFRRYISLMRRLQSTYWLEPAGSHGVWGLDDYHFLPFLFGAAQLIDHPRLRPKSIHQPEIVDNFAADYLYFDMIRQVNATKIGAPSLRWHSPLLDDISGVKEWSKVLEGLTKMYNAEVLGKLPIVQHLLFGSLLPFEPPSGAIGHPEHYDPSHVHFHVHAMGQEAPECCNMRVPSAQAGIAAAKEREREALLLPNVGAGVGAGPWIATSANGSAASKGDSIAGNGPRGKVAETGYLVRKPRDPAAAPIPMPKFQPPTAIRPMPFD